jgi:basic membrane lipoprotein Med (substrate-binding protein (PBP1-ABC) superfamily)
MRTAKFSNGFNIGIQQVADYAPIEVMFIPNVRHHPDFEEKRDPDERQDPTQRRKMSLTQTPN